MVPFEELQQLWQNQPQPEPPAVAAESRGMAAALRRFRRRQYFINAGKLVLLFSLMCVFLSRLGISVLTVLGQSLFLAGMIAAIVTDWRIQSAVARLDFTRPSVGFVDSTLERLRDPNAPFRRTGWMVITLVTVGINLMFASQSTPKSLPSRIVSHAAATLILFATFALALQFRAKRYALDYKPLVERLAAIKDALAEQAR